MFQNSETSRYIHQKLVIGTKGPLLNNINIRFNFIIIGGLDRKNQYQSRFRLRQGGSLRQMSETTHRRK